MRREGDPGAIVDIQTLLHLQRTAGNQAVAHLVAQRQTARAANPEDDPRFQGLTRDIRGKQARLSAHPDGRRPAGAAQDAALAPPDDREAQAKTAQSGKMAAAKPGTFDRAAFIAAVDQAIAAQAPKTLDDADKFASSGKPAAIKGAVTGRVAEGKQASAGQIESTTKATPDTSVAVEKKVVPLSPDRPPGTPATPNPEQAVPDRAPASATDFSAGPKQVEDAQRENDVTDDQLKKGNEPEFDAALQQKQELKEYSETAPGQVRASEAKTLEGARAEAATTGAAAMSAMAVHRVQAGQRVGAGQQTAKGSDETKRAQVTATLQKVFDATKRDVEEILSGLDHQVDQQFDAEEGAARRAFEADMQKRMDDYKAQRYGGFTGKLRWVKDQFMGLPPEANQIFVAAREGYVASMRQVISSIADTIGAELTRAKARIAQGRADLEAEVHRLPADLRALGQEAATGFDSQFDELTQSVDARGQELVQTLADKYTQAMNAVDAEIDAEKAKNQGLVAKAVGAITGVIQTIIQLKDLLMGVLARAAQAVTAIIKDPIGFLGHLVTAVGAGLKNFIANIADHLKKGLVSWLMGAAAQAGLQLPDKFDLKGIVQLIAGLLGLTWSAIRGRIVSRGVPDQAISAAEQAVPEAQLLAREGLPGLWQQIVSKIGDLKSMLLGKLADFLIPTVLVAGITWIISLLNPASAFVKAVKAIIDIVTFIFERGAQILEFVDSVLDAIIAIAAGGVAGVPALIENALARSIPVLIGFLAALLGVGGITDKVREVVQAISRPITKVVDWVVDKIAGVARRFWARLKGGFGRGKGPETEAAKRKRLDAGVAAGVAAVGRLSGGRISAALIRPVLAAIRVRYRMQVLEPVERNGRWAVHGVVNPEKEEPTDKQSGTADEEKFPYAIGPAEGHVRTTPIEPAIVHLDEIDRAPMEGKDRMTGFVVNMAATPGEVKPAMASRYLSEAWANYGAESMAAARTAVVVGVNTWERLDPQADQAAGRQKVLAAMNAVGQPAGLRMAVFGFSWAPSWIHKAEKRPVELSVVRAAYEKLSPDEKQKAVAENERGWRDDKKLPYGIFREAVMGSPYTRRAVDLLRKANDPVHIVSQDADTDVVTRSGVGVLAAYDRILRAMAQQPLLTIGGYNFDGLSWQQNADPRTVQLTKLANELDRAVRAAIAGVHPQMLYPTEPNMLIKAWDSGIGDGIFQNDQIIADLANSPGSVYGVGATEGRTLRNRLMKTYGNRFSMVYAPDAGVSTSPAPDDPTRGLAVTPEGVQGAAQPLDAILRQAQSYASARTLAREFSRANPSLGRADQAALQQHIFSHFTEVARLMVANPALTKDSPEIRERLAALRRDVEALPIATDSPPPQQAIDQAHEVARTIIGTMTAGELKDLWTRLRTLLDQVMSQRNSGGGAQS